jgi:hypothetical protein
MTSLRHMPLALAAALACASAPAWAEEPSPPPAEPTPASAPLTPEALEALSGGAAPDVSVLSNQNLTANNTGSTITADTLQSGDISFSESAFSGFNGVGNFVFNTGANNILQGVVSVNVVSVPDL